MDRRHAMCCSTALAAGLFTGLGTPARAVSFDEGWRNPCRGALPPDLAHHDLVLQAFEGIDAQALWDVHTHLLGTGDSGSGCSVDPRMHTWWHPGDVLRRRAIMNAACVAPGAASVDIAFVERLHALASDFPRGARWLLFAFDRAHDEHGRSVPTGPPSTCRTPMRRRWRATMRSVLDGSLRCTLTGTTRCSDSMQHSPRALPD